MAHWLIIDNGDWALEMFQNNNPNELLRGESQSERGKRSLAQHQRSHMMDTW